MAAALDFKKIEVLRETMLLSVSDFAKFFGVSRQTYYSWTRGVSPRPALEKKLRGKVRELLFLVTEKGWPRPEVVHASRKNRYDLLVTECSFFEPQ